MDEKYLARDPRARGAVLNTDLSGLQAYKARRKANQTLLQQINTLEQRIAALEQLVAQLTSGK